MRTSKYIAISATIVSIIALFPEFNKLRKTKEVKSYSEESIILSILGGILWVIYHIIDGRYIDTFATTIYIIMNIYKFSFF